MLWMCTKATTALTEWLNSGNLHYWPSASSPFSPALWRNHPELNPVLIPAHSEYNKGIHTALDGAISSLRLYK